MAAVQLANSAAALAGHVTTIDSAPLRSSTLITCSLDTGVGAGNASGMNAGEGGAMPGALRAAKV